MKAGVEEREAASRLQEAGRQSAGGKRGGRAGKVGSCTINRCRVSNSPMHFF